MKSCNNNNRKHTFQCIKQNNKQTMLPSKHTHNICSACVAASVFPYINSSDNLSLQ